jgi:glycosyltransferase involved in cell wall biosynthesis
MVGSGKLEHEVKSIAASDPQRFRVLPFQNQAQMPLVYRLGDVFVLPSSFGETWGLAANEALACGRPVLLSDHVGCAADVVDGSCGRIFPRDDFETMARAASEMMKDIPTMAAMRSSAARRAWLFDLQATESKLVECLTRMNIKSDRGQKNRRALSFAKPLTRSLR